MTSGREATIIEDEAPRWEDELAGCDGRGSGDGDSTAAQMDLVVADHTSLQKLRGSRRTVFWLPTGNIVLRLPELQQDEKEDWEARLNRSYHDCGCSAGAVFGVAFVAFILLHGVATGEGVAVQSSGELLAMVFGILGFSAIGKTIGVIRSRSRLRQDLTELIAMLGQSDLGSKRAPHPRRVWGLTPLGTEQEVSSTR